MCSLKSVESGKRLSIQLSSFWAAGASAGASLNSAMGCHLKIQRGASGLLVLADQQLVVGEVHVRRHLEVVRRGLVLEDTAGHVERRAMAGTQEATLPVV